MTSSLEKQLINKKPKKIDSQHTNIQILCKSETFKSFHRPLCRRNIQNHRNKMKPPFLLYTDGRSNCIKVSRTPRSTRTCVAADKVLRRVEPNESSRHWLGDAPRRHASNDLLPPSLHILLVLKLAWRKFDLDQFSILQIPPEGRCTMLPGNADRGKVRNLGRITYLFLSHRLQTAV